MARDILTHLFSCRRRQGEDWRPTEALYDRAKTQVVRAEVVTPLADAVRLVHNEQADRARQETVEEVAVLEALRGEIQNLTFAPLNLLMELARLAGRQVGVHCQRIHADGIQLVELVLHESDERADDERQPGHQDRRKLIDERLSAAGRHDHDGIAATQHSLHRLPLTLLEIAMSEPVGEHTKCLRA